LGALPGCGGPACPALDREPPGGGVGLADVDGAFKRWFDEAPGGIVILRPDRIVAAVCKPWELSETLRTLARRMSLETPGQQSEPVHVEAPATVKLKVAA